MKNKIPLLFLWLSAALGFISSGLHASTVDLLNPGFEAGTGTVANWGAVGAATFTRVTGSAGIDTHRGRYAVSIGGVAAGSPINNRWVQLSTSYFTVAAKQSFDISAWLKGSPSWDLTKD